MDLYKWLSHPKLRGLSVDDPRTTTLRREIISENTFLRQIYLDWYARLGSTIQNKPGKILELGSGAGFLSDYVPNLITSDVVYLPFVDIILKGQKLPFISGSLRGIFISNVLHHIPYPRDFYLDAARCIYPGGVISMIEPWVSTWSKIIYTHLHQEPFQPDSRAWEFPSTGPLSGANGALPWILFKRDKDVFEKEFPEWKIHSIIPFMPFRYLISGGVSLRPLMPKWSYNAWVWLESQLSPWMDSWAMFAHITLKRQ